MLWCCYYILANKSFNVSIFISNVEYLLLVFIFLSENSDFLQVACLHNLWFIFLQYLFFGNIFHCFLFVCLSVLLFIFIVRFALFSLFVLLWMKKNHYFTLIIERYFHCAQNFQYCLCFYWQDIGYKYPESLFEWFSSHF